MAQVIDIKVSKIDARRIVKANVKHYNKGKIIVLFEDNDCYMAYDDDAQAIATHCFTIAIDILGGKAIIITKDMIDTYFPRLVKCGYKICVIE